MREPGRLLLTFAVGLAGGATAGAAVVLLERRRQWLASDQEWFWKPEWLAGEARATEDILAGRMEVFEDEGEFLKTMFKEAELELNLEPHPFAPSFR